MIKNINRWQQALFRTRNNGLAYNVHSILYTNQLRERERQNTKSISDLISVSC